MLADKTRSPTDWPRQKTIWTNDAILAFRLQLGTLFLLMIGCTVCSLSGVKVFDDIKNGHATSTSAAQATLHGAQTLTAMPTPTQTLTPTLKPTLTPTPIYLWNTTIPDDHRQGGVPYIRSTSNGELFVAYFLEENDDLSIMKYSGNKWQPVGNLTQINRGNQHAGIYFAMAVSQTGVPWLAYLTAKKSPARYAFFTSDNNWSTGTSISENVEIYDIRIVLDFDDIVHFAFLLKNGELRYRKTDSSSIRVETGVQPTDTAAPFEYYPITIAVSTNNTPYLCYPKLEKLYCAYESGGSWQKSFVADNGIFPTLAIDRSGNLHLAYYDVNKTNLMYAFSDDGTNWKVFTVDSSAQAGIHPALAIDNNNMIHISYYDKARRQLKYAFGRDNKWQIFTPDSSQNDVGFNSSIAIDKNGTPVIAYLDRSIARIKVVFGIKQ